MRLYNKYRLYHEVVGIYTLRAEGPEVCKLRGDRHRVVQLTCTVVMF